MKNNFNTVTAVIRDGGKEKPKWRGQIFYGVRTKQIGAKPGTAKLT
jgi:hypothetical protein